MSAQPPKSAAYTAASNPVDRTPAEKNATTPSASNPARNISHRGPDSEDPNAGGLPAYGLGQGIRSSGPADEREAKGKVEPRQVDEAEQMAAPGEGRVAAAVEEKHGAQLAEGQKPGDVVIDDFAGDLERKKQEQAEKREKVVEARKAGVDVDGGLDSGRKGIQTD